MKHITNRDMFILSLFSLITIVAWIVFDVYHAATTSQITPVQQELMTPVNPVFDTSVIQELKNQ